MLLPWHVLFCEMIVFHNLSGPYGIISDESALVCSDCSGRCFHHGQFDWHLGE